MRNSKFYGDPLFGSSVMIWDALAFAQSKQRSVLDEEIVSVADSVSVDRLHKREGILDAAEKLIRRFGHTKTSMEDISRVIGTSRANIYRFFPTKEALDEEVFARHASAVLKRARTAAQSETEAGEQLLAAVTSLVDQTVSMVENDPHMHRLFATAFDEDWDASDLYITEINALVEAIIGNGISTGDFAVSDPALATQFVVTSMIVFIHPALVADAALKHPSLTAHSATQMGPILTYLQAGDRKRN